MGATTSDNRYNDIKTIFEWGFENHDLVKIGDSGDIVQTINIDWATQETKKLNLSIEESITILINKENVNKKIEPKIELNENLKPPISKGSIVGKIIYDVDGIQYTTNLIASQDVKRSNLLIYILILFILIVTILITARIINKKKQKDLWKLIKNG